MADNRFDMGVVNMVTHQDDQLYEIYHENTKLNPYNEFAMNRQIQRIVSNPPLLEMLTKGYLRFPLQPSVQLASDFPPTGCSLEEAIARRRSVREYTDEPVSLVHLSQLLHLSYGITGSWQFSHGTQYLRAAPSAGGLFPLELYLLAPNVDGLDPGIYHYNVPDHSLERLPGPSDLRTAISGLSGYNAILNQSAAIFVITAVFDRTTFKYGDRGYRFILLDAGHMAENTLLGAAALNLGGVAIGGFYDDLLSSLVGADGINEGAIYMLCVGHPKPDERTPRSD